MPTKPSYMIYGEALNDAYLKKQWALKAGVEASTIRSQCYAPPSGKANTIDRCAAFIRFIHPFNPGAAREVAKFFSELVDELDQTSGIACEAADDGILPCLKSAMKESHDVLESLMSNDLGLSELRGALTEIEEDRAAIERLDAVVREKIRKREVQELNGLSAK